MRVTRRRVSPRSLTTNSRVELLPQSSAATVLVTNVHHLYDRYVQFLRHQCSDRIVRPDQKVGQVRVKTLDTESRTAHTTRWLRTVVAKRRLRATLRHD